MSKVSAVLFQKVLRSYVAGYKNSNVVFNSDGWVRFTIKSA